jgi:hypothetical protein
MRNKKLMALPLLVIFALSVTGYAFANWTKTLTINGTVETATLDLTFSYVSLVTETDPYDVGTTELDPSGYTTGTVHNVMMTVNNAYPGYKARISFDITNIGTIPAELVGFNLNSGPTAIPLSASLSGGTVTFHVSNGAGETLGVGDTHTYQLTLEVTTAAEPDATYSFTVGIVFEQGV